jgi:hypothetical protein
MRAFSTERREFLGEIGVPMLPGSHVMTRRSSSLIRAGGFPEPVEREPGDRLTDRRAPDSCWRKEKSTGPDGRKSCSAARKPALCGLDADHRSVDGSRLHLFSPPALISGERPAKGPGSTLVHEDAHSSAVGCRHGLSPAAGSQPFYLKSGMDGDAVFGLDWGCLPVRRRVKFDRPWRSTVFLVSL